MTITLHIYNSIDSKTIMAIMMPWDYRKAITGFYSGLWKYFKIVCASNEKIDKRFLRMKIIMNKKFITDRFEITFPSGMKFNSPFDLNATDFKIIGLHLEALKLSVGEIKTI